MSIRNVRTAVKATEEITDTNRRDNVPRDISQYRFIYPEFLPDPKIEFRNKIREKLERGDMIAVRNQIDIPQFYVGE